MQSFSSEERSLVFLFVVGLVSCQTPPTSDNNSCRQTTKCVSSGSDSMVTFQTQPGGTEVLMNMTTKAVNQSGWMGVGFSYDNMMGNDSVVLCILMKNGTIIVKNSYNIESPNDNNIDIPESYNGITVDSTSYANGTLQCTLRRSVSVVTASDRIFNLTQSYYILIANGPIDDQGNRMFHDTHRYASQNSVDVTSDFLVPRDRHYFLDKTGNLVSFCYLPESDEVEFEFRGPINSTGRWISLGFSKDVAMGDDSVLDCLILTNGSVVVQNSYNLPNSKFNIPLNSMSMEGITMIKTSNNNGSLYCAFRRRIANFQNNQIFSLNAPYYLLLGDGNLNDDGTKLKHDHIPAVSNSAVDIRTVTGNVSRFGEISPTPSPVANGYAVFTDDVNHNRVLFRLSDDGQSVEFIIEGPASDSGSWIAVGFSYNDKMNDDSVLDCIRLPNGTFIVQNSFNNNNGKNIIVNADGIRVLATSLSGSKMSCRLTRDISSNNAQIYPFNQTYYLLLAAGYLSGDQKTYHGPSSRIASKEKVNLTAYQIISSKDQTNLIRAHGCLMITAFVMLMSGAIIIARYYKTCWPEDKLCGTAVWFSVHRFIMVLGLFSCAAGFIIIFCYSDGKLKGFPKSPSYFSAHGPMGIAVMILIIMNPIIALLRCKPDDDKRWIFNWLHFTVGTCCQILAGITLFFGIKISGDVYKLNHFSVFWILIAFVGFHVFIELLLLLEKLITERHGRRSFTVTYGMSSPGEAPSTVKQEENASRESLLFRYFVLALYVLITMGLWLAMIILIGGGFKA